MARPARLHRLLTVKLETVALPAPVVALELRSGRVTTAAAREPDLFRRSGVSDWPQLLDNLSARLGPQSVHGLRCADEHRPERAFDLVAAEAERVPPGTTDAVTDDSTVPARPLWLLPEPCALSSFGAGAVTCESGPERIESGWWDGADVARDYYVATTQGGECLWIYRERRAPHDWHVHGVFA